MDAVKSKKPHTLYLAAKICITGVAGVISMTEKQAEIALEDNTLTLWGHGFSPLHLDVEAGELQMAGTVTSLRYGSSGKESLWKRMLK